MASTGLKFSEQRTNLLSSSARIQAPFVKVTIGNYTFGVFDKTAASDKDAQGFYKAAKVQFPNFVQNLTIKKINGQVNQYTLTVNYPVTQYEDPNFFEKVLSSVSMSRKIIFTYGDSTQPTYVYKDEEAIITKVTEGFNLPSSVITYTISAVSGAALGTASCCNFPAPSSPVKPSTIIKNLFNNPAYGLQEMFTGMSTSTLEKLIDGGDKEVVLDSKLNCSALDYISYLVGCMIPAGSNSKDLSKDIYILTIHDDTVYDSAYNNNPTGLPGPYFKVTKTSYVTEQSDAYNIDIGFNTSTIVTNFSIQNNENYSLLYDYQSELYSDPYVRRLDGNGKWVDVYAPSPSSKNNKFETRAEDISWWTKITKYPISATITIQGLLRPAQLMTYVRLNIIFPTGHKHIGSGLYIITSQTDEVGYQGYRTTLEMTKISGDNYTKVNPSL